MSVGDSVTIYLIPSVQFSLETRSFSLENASQKISMAARKMCCILVGDLHASICILTFQFSHANGIMIAGMPLLDEGVMAAIKICRSPSSSSSKSFLFEDVLPFTPLLISKRNEYLQIPFRGIYIRRRERKYHRSTMMLCHVATVPRTPFSFSIFNTGLVLFVISSFRSLERSETVFIWLLR